MNNGGDEKSSPFPFVNNGGDEKSSPFPFVKNGGDEASPPFPFVKNGGDETSPPFPPRFARSVTMRLQQLRIGNTTRRSLRSGFRARAPGARRDSRRALPAHHA